MKLVAVTTALGFLLLSVGDSEAESYQTKNIRKYDYISLKKSYYRVFTDDGFYRWCYDSKEGSRCFKYKSGYLDLLPDIQFDKNQNMIINAHINGRDRTVIVDDEFKILENNDLGVYANGYTYAYTFGGTYFVKSNKTKDKITLSGLTGMPQDNAFKAFSYLDKPVVISKFGWLYETNGSRRLLDQSVKIAKLYNSTLVLMSSSKISIYRDNKSKIILSKGKLVDICISKNFVAYIENNDVYKLDEKFNKRLIWKKTGASLACGPQHNLLMVNTKTGNIRIDLNR
jgi:hypothetical protein